MTDTKRAEIINAFKLFISDEGLGPNKKKQES